MDEYLKLKDETILADSKAYETGDSLYVLIKAPGMSIVEVFNLLADPEKTGSIVYHYYKAELVFDGYTDIESIAKEKTRVVATLVKEVAQDE